MTAPAFLSVPSTHQQGQSAPSGRDVIILVSTGSDPVGSLPVLRSLEADVRVVRPIELAAVDVTGAAVLVDVRGDDPQRLEALRGAARAGGPVIAVTDAAGVSGVAAGWDVDDLVLDTAPRAELAARLRLRRERMAFTVRPAADRLAVGDLVIFPAEHVATVGDRSLSLTFREFRLLVHLAANVGRVVRRDELLRAVWERPDAIGLRTVDVHIARLRRKLGQQHGELVYTVRKVGYRLSQPTDHATAA